MARELERCFAIEGFRGIKVYQVGCPYDDERFGPAWEFARERGAPVLAHTWGGDLTGLDKAAEQNPDVNFLAAHSGSAFAYRPYIEAAQKCPNLYLDITYSREHTGMIEHFVERLGPDRIVWGSDAPCFSMSHQLGKILFARIPDEAKRKIIHTTAARLFLAGGRPMWHPVNRGGACHETNRHGGSDAVWRPVSELVQRHRNVGACWASPWCFEAPGFALGGWTRAPAVSRRRRARSADETRDVLLEGRGAGG